MMVLYCNGVKCGKARGSKKADSMGYKNILIYVNGSRCGGKGKQDRPGLICEKISSKIVHLT
jgi:hypothetical protein